MLRSTCMLVTLMSLAATAERAGALQAVGQIAAGAGTATDERGVRSDVVTLAPSVTFTPGASSTLMLGANATRFANSAWLVGGSAAYAAQSGTAGGFSLGFNGSASATHASFNATFAQADATPALEWTAGALTLIGGVHAGTGYTAVSTGPAPLIPGSAQLVTQSRTSFAPSYGGELRFGSADAVSAVLSYRDEPTRVGGMLVTDQIAGATLAFGSVTVSAVGGHRSAPDEQVGFASGSLSAPITSVLSFTVAGGSYPSNRLTGASGGRFFSTGLSLRIGGPRALTPPQPAGVRAAPPLYTRLAIRAADAQRVELAGDWNSWKPSPATRASNGVWYADVPLKPGEYRYAFLVDGTQWRVPDGVVAVDDGFGGKAAYVTVKTAESELAKHNQEER